MAWQWQHLPPAAAVPAIAIATGAPHHPLLDIEHAQADIMAIAVVELLEDMAEEI